MSSVRTRSRVYPLLSRLNPVCCTARLTYTRRTSCSIDGEKEQSRIRAHEKDDEHLNDLCVVC